MTEVLTAVAGSKAGLVMMVAAVPVPVTVMVTMPKVGRGAVVVVTSVEVAAELEAGMVTAVVEAVVVALARHPYLARAAMLLRQVVGGKVAERRREHHQGPHRRPAPGVLHCPRWVWEPGRR